MDSVAQPSDHFPEKPGKSNRRRRWWLIIPFLILSSLVILGVFVFSEGEQPTYRFLAQARQVSVREFISDAGHRPNQWLRMVTYRIDLPVDHLAATARKELPPSDWIERSHAGEFAFFDNRRIGKAVLIINEGPGTEVNVSQYRSATYLDRIRLWFRNFGRHNANPEDEGSP